MTTLGKTEQLPASVFWRYWTATTTSQAGSALTAVALPLIALVLLDASALEVGMLVAAGDLGSSASRKFDIEAWFPSQGAYRELTSTSNCTTFQARRLNIRTRGEKGNEPVATLNGTLCAAARTIACLLENTLAAALARRGMRRGAA